MRSPDIVTTVGEIATVAGSVLMVASAMGKLDVFDKGMEMMLAGTLLAYVGYHRKTVAYQRDDDASAAPRDGTTGDGH